MGAKLPKYLLIVLNFAVFVSTTGKHVRLKNTPLTPLYMMENLTPEVRQNSRDLKLSQTTSRKGLHILCLDLDFIVNLWFTWVHCIPIFFLFVIQNIVCGYS